MTEISTKDMIDLDKMARELARWVVYPSNMLRLTTNTGSDRLPIDEGMVANKIKSAMQAVRDETIDECDEILMNYYIAIKDAIYEHNNVLLKTCLDLTIDNQEQLRALKERKEP